MLYLRKNRKGWWSLALISRGVFAVLFVATLPARVPSHAAGQAASQEWHAMTFRADAPGLESNPLRGLVPFATARPPANLFPYSMEWFTLPLSAVVTGPDTYDWSVLERQLQVIAAHGNQAIFRFYLDNPKLPSAIPKYLLNAGLKTFPYDDEGNRASATPSVGPDYSDPRLIECLTRFIHAFGSKYDGDPRIAYLTAGLYGFWGEWHVLKHPLPGEPAGWTISEKNKDALLRAFAEAFQRTPVLVRTPGVTNDRQLLSNFGFHDDSFLYDTVGLNPARFWSGMQRAGTTESWQRHPTGGEIYPPLQSGLWNVWPNAQGQDFAAAIDLTHVTFLFDSALFSKAATETERRNALRMQRMMGYTLFCSSARIVQSRSGLTAATVRIENRGVAPLYYSWPVEVEALDDAAKVTGEGRTVWPLATLLPGKSAEWSITFNASANRTKSVVLRLANPMPGGHPIAFANAEMGSVKAGWLTLFRAGI
jgi:hypothetical protein